ncbi:hypothetical protein [Georgenia daeguensis]|uniref:VCBS repeat-containing protein n=1 Tax=Georgenia daeguensis TaxID=908355 RepID=A0ABP8EXU3_9MICO
MTGLAVTAILVLGAQAAAAQGSEAGGAGNAYLMNDDWRRNANRVFTYGRADDRVYVGDWNGDGIDTLAVRRANVYHFANGPSGGPTSNSIVYGSAGDTVLMGDWDGDGDDTPAVRRGNVYHLKNNLSSGRADRVVMYGRSSDTVVVGDWDGDGKDSFGVRRGSTYYFKNSLSGGPADYTVTYGEGTEVVFVGDWDGDGRDTPAVRRGNAYHVSDDFSGGPADRVLNYGRTADTTLVGDWDGDGTDTLAVRRSAAAASPFAPDRALRDVVRKALLGASHQFPDMLGTYSTDAGFADLRWAFRNVDTRRNNFFSVAGCTVDDAGDARCSVYYRGAKRFGLDPDVVVGTVHLVEDARTAWQVTRYDSYVTWYGDLRYY